MTASYPLPALRTLALHAQELTTPNGAEPAPTLEAIARIVTRLGCVQIDTLQMVARSHYLVLWSRLGCYAPADFDRLIYDPAQRGLFEGWLHAACIVPLTEYRYLYSLTEHTNDWYTRWLAETHNAEVVPVVLDRVRQEGALRAADFEYAGPRRSSWWDWKPAKTALEYLFATGHLMITNRVNFQRVYDLTERVLPGWVERNEVTAEERNRHWVEQGVKVFGVCTPTQAADYAYRKQIVSKPLVAELLKEGILAAIRGPRADGQLQSWLIHRDHLPLLEQAADGIFTAERTTFLSPFDSLFWAKRRDEQLWGFRQSLEAYTPAPKRIWGYFCLPILHRGRLVGRFDPKIERKTGTLRLKALYLEPGVELEERLIAEVAAALRDFMAFHHATKIVIERSQPEMWGEKLLTALS